MKFCVKKFHGLLAAATMAMLIEFLMGLSDGVVLGNMLGEKALAGLNLMQPPMNFVSFVANLIGVGTAICFSLEVGRFNEKRAHEMFSQGLLSGLLLGGLLFLGFVLGRDLFLGGFGAAPDVLVHATAYWNWFAPNALLEVMAVILTNACYADGDGRTCMISYCVQLGGNVLLSILFVKLMGTGGCALGTTIGNLCAIGVLSTHFRRKTNTLAFVRHFAWRDLVRICQASFGDAGSRLCWAVLFLLLNKYVIAHFGSDALTVLSVAIMVIGFSEAFNGVSTAAQPLVGVYVGERNTRGVRDVMAAANRVSLCAGLGVAALLIAFPKLAVSLVGVDEPELVRQACVAVRFTAAGLVCAAFATLYNSYYLFIEHEGLACFLTFLANLGGYWLLYPVLGHFLGLNGVWTAIMLGPCASVGIFATYLLCRYGRANFPYLLPKDREAKLHVFNLELDETRICGVSAEVASVLRQANADTQVVARVALMVEEVFMAVRDRNKDRHVLAEATLDLNDGVMLTLRDDGEIFDITDADAGISSLRTYLVASMMEHQANRKNLTTTGFNRNVFRF